MADERKKKDVEDREPTSAEDDEREDEEEEDDPRDHEEDEEEEDDEEEDEEEAPPPKKTSSKKANRSASEKATSKKKPRRQAPPPPPPPKTTLQTLAPVGHLVFVAAAAIGVYSFVSVAKEGELRRRCTPTCILHPQYAGFERKAPSFTLKDTKGHDVSLDSYKGKVVVLNFWTKTCGPCMEEMPEIADLARILKPMGDVEVVTVSTDETAQEAIDTLKAVLKEEPPFRVLMDPESSVVKEKFGTSLFPETWIIDKQGIVRARFDGAREWSNATVVQLVDQIRGGGFCPVTAREGKFVGESAKVCESLSGG